MRHRPRDDEFGSSWGSGDSGDSDTYSIFLFLVSVFETFVDEGRKLNTEIGGGTSSLHGKPSHESLVIILAGYSLYPAGPGKFLREQDVWGD